MIAPFDIFQITKDQALLWRGAVSTMDDANARIAVLAASDPGEYMILSQKTGHQLRVTAPAKSGNPQRT